MRVAVMGASGRVGLRLLEAIAADPGLELAAALVSPSSRLIGMAIGGGSLVYRPIEPAMNCHADVFVDFSTPAATLALQEAMGDKTIPVVIGTTGFDAEQEAALDRHAERRALLVAPNFAVGFATFERAVLDAARCDPGARATIVETYHARKKAEPSGTSRHLARSIAATRREAAGIDLGEPEIVVRRESAVVGVTEVHFDLGTAELAFRHSVRDLSAFADGALAAARNLSRTAAVPGRRGLDITASNGKDLR